MKDCDKDYSLQSRRGLVVGTAGAKTKAIMTMVGLAAAYMPNFSMRRAEYQNPLTGRIGTVQNPGLTKEQQLDRIAKAEAKRLRKQNKRDIK